VTTRRTPQDQHEPDDRSSRVEQLVRRALQDLPSRQAPHSLQTRVLATVNRRERTWWQRPFAAWPLPARVAFAVCCATMAKLSIDGSMWLLNSTPSVWQFESSTFAAWHALAAAHATLIASIPTLWWYSVLAIIATACGGVFALGAVAYRTLYAVRD
jgi:hypothetical protein